MILYHANHILINKFWTELSINELKCAPAPLGILVHQTIKFIVQKVLNFPPNIDPR